MANIAINFTLNAQQDPHFPIYGETDLGQLKAEWIRNSVVAQDRQLKNVAPIKSVALVGAVRNRDNGRINLRDAIACQSIMQEMNVAIPLTEDCDVDFFNLAEGTDIFASDKVYDLVIFCNIRKTLPSLNSHYQKLVTEGRLAEALQDKHDTIMDRIVADALRPSDVLSGIKFTDITHEHKHYVMVSESALSTDAYANLAKRLKARFIACWGFEQFIDGDYFSSPAIYNGTLPPGKQFTNRDDFTLTYDKKFGDDLLRSFMADAPRVMPRPPSIQLAVRNDVLEAIGGQDHEVARTNLLLKGGIELLQKLDLTARLQSRRGRKQITNSWNVAGKSLTRIQEKLSRPLNLIERAELFFRRTCG